MTQPCQLRYLYYFEAFYRHKIKSPSVKRLKGIQFFNIPNYSQGGCVPYFEVYNCKGLETTKVFTYPADRFYNQKEGGAVFLLTERQKMAWTIHGDVKIMFRHAGFSTKTICRLMFNTSFIQRGNYIKAGKMELSPEDIRKDKRIPNNFIVYIFFEDFCNTCNPYLTEIVDLCDNCKNEIGEETIQEWLDVKEVLDNHCFPDEEKGRGALPNVDPQLLNESM